MNEQEYLQEIEKYYLSLKGSLTFLSPNESNLILKWYKENRDLKLIKKLIKEEIAKLPERKKKYFSLLSVEKRLSEKKEKAKKDKAKQKKVSIWEKVVKAKNLPEELLKVPDDYKGDINLYQEKNIISYIWKNMSLEEKEKLKKEAILELRNYDFLPDDIKSTIKAIIYNKIKESLLNV
ncbi:hypothetical protein [Hydrogenothermus marinus]|uniref:Uncharacterized protein n=1 Tax=Hydrogenothermus marinus TaxID=133270 RepID=A0A3M0B6T7_9AQUI|nr:hypothetical protein [Hydrogenothermus marinus]RMA93120.1 hypothetical protein CLV39_1451 [Hydrogenothermus marinus]